jgi:hypothetical protein
MVISCPEMTIGSKSSSKVSPNVYLGLVYLREILNIKLTVVPAKVTVAPVWRLCKSIVLEGGAEMLESTILVQDLTAEEIEAYAVTTQVVPVTTAWVAESAMVGAVVTAT